MRVWESVGKCGFGGSLLGIRAFSLDKMLAKEPDFLVGEVWGRCGQTAC